jgi:hypothetical protein
MPNSNDIIDPPTSPGTAESQRRDELYKISVLAEAMRKKLVANAYKGGWQNMSVPYMMDRITDERNELDNAIWRLNKFRKANNGKTPRVLLEDILSEAADIANFAMMIADVAGALHNYDDYKE